MTDEYDFHNKDGQYRIGDMVMINPEVNSSDNMRDYVDGEHSLLELIAVLNQPTNVHDHWGSGHVTLRSWDGRETDRMGWAIFPVDGLEGCYLCTSQCKKEDVCEFFFPIRGIQK